jgi:hypothetical protein
MTNWYDYWAELTAEGLSRSKNQKKFVEDLADEMTKRIGLDAANDALELLEKKFRAKFGYWPLDLD